MKKIKVRIYGKNSDGQGAYQNKTAQFLQKAAYGTQVKNVLVEIDDFILEELLSKQDPDTIAFKIQDKYGLNYYQALDRVEDMKSVYESNADDSKKDETIDFIPEATPYFKNDNETEFGNRYNYPTMSEESMALDEEAFPWESEESPDNDYEAAASQILGSESPTASQEPVGSMPAPVGLTEKFNYGGNMPKHKFVKKIVKDLKKAAEGTEQQDTEANEATTNDIPVNGRSQLVSNFRRGIKDLGNEYYAKQLYDQSKQLEQQQFPGAAEGMQINQPEIDPENPAHHLLAFSQAMGDTFSTPMNQTQQVGEDGIPEARYGRRMIRKAARQWDKMFGDVPVGMFGVGVPNYLGYLIPREGMGVPQVDPRQMYLSGMDVSFTKRPFRKTMEIRNIPFYMPSGQGANMIPYTYPGEIITRDVVTEETKAFGGPIMNPQPNQYGQLQRFVGGGDDMPTPAYSAYAENDVNTKDVEDPYFKHGGLHKFDGTDNSQVNTFKPITTQAELDAYLANYNKQQQQLQYDQYMRSMPYAFGYSNNPWKNLKQGLSLFNQNPYTGQNYDFYWMSQKGPVMKDGQPWQPTQQPTQQGYAEPQGEYNTSIGDASEKMYVTDSQAEAYHKARELNPNLSVKDFLGQSSNNGFPQMQTDPTQAGYRPDIKYDQRGLFGRKKSASITWNWYDPANNPAGQPTSQPANSKETANISTETPQTKTDYSEFSRKAQRNIRQGERQMDRWDRRAERNPEGNVNPIFYNKAATSNQVNLEPTTSSSIPTSTGAPTLSTYTDGPINQGGIQLPEIPTGNPPVIMRKAYGGVPHFQGLDESEVQFDPNANKQAVDPNYHPSFTTEYDIHKARTLNTRGINTWKNFGLYGAKGVADSYKQLYDDAYLGANTTSNNKVPANELAFRGSFSGQNQRRIADPETNPYFNQPVGTAKTGGTMQYKKGGVYDLTEEEIGAILAAGGQIKFI